MDINNQYGHLEEQKAILEILKAIHDFCGQNNIHYCLDGGSVLGAVRENGFIPWDNDADIALKRVEFNKLWVLKDRFTGYRVESDSEDAPWVFRVRAEGDDHNQVDIFIYDNLPDNPGARKKKILRMAMMQGMLKKNADNTQYSAKQKVLVTATKLIGKFFSQDKKMRMYTRYSQIGNDTPTSKINTFNSSYRALYRQFDADVLDEVVLHQFEDTQLYIPAKYDHYLRVMYGDDYMTPPKEQFRGTHQGYLDDPDVTIELASK